jgi:serine/threonine protein kinase
MYEMLTGKLPFPIKKGLKLSRRIYQQEVDYPKKIDNNAKDLMQKLLILDPNERLGSGPEGGEKIKKGSSGSFYYI